IPDAMRKQFSNEQLEMVLLHELAHVRRRDVLVHEACLMLRNLHWFNPAAWWALQRMQGEREIACDELVLDASGKERSKEYGLTLLDVVQRSTPGIAAAGLLGTSDTTSRLQRRLAMIRDYRGRSRRATVVAVVTIALACCMGLTNPPAAD